MADVLLILIGLIIGIGISYWSDKPRMNKYHNEGYDHAVDDMIRWNCFFDQRNQKHFVNVTLVEIDEGEGEP